MAEEDYTQIMSQPLPMFDPVADLADFIQRSESQRQQAVNRVGENMANAKWIDYSDPVQLDVSPPLTKSEASSPQKDIILDGGGTNVSQDWLVTATGSNDDGDKTWTMKGGKVYDVTTGSITVVPDTELTGNAGEVYLQIERNPTTRAVVEVTPFLAEITPESFDQLQYKRIARLEEVTLEGAELPSFTKPIQVQFGDIVLWEDLIVSNGAFKLMTFAASIGNSYDA